MSLAKKIKLNPLRYSKILIADDSPFFRLKIKQILTGSQIGWKFYEAKDGQDAITQYLKNRPTLVIMDIIMPKIDGRMATKTIRKIDPHAKIIVISAQENKDIVDDVVNHFGAKDYLLKPFDSGQVVMTVSKHLVARKQA